MSSPSLTISMNVSELFYYAQIVITALIPVVLRAYDAVEGTLTVETVELAGEPPDPTLTVQGTEAYLTAYPWPGQHVSDYALFVDEGAISRKTTLLPAMQWAGHWWVMALGKLRMFAPRPNYPISHLQPAAGS